MFYAAAQTLAGGRKAGLMASLGIHLGGYGHIFAAAVGLTFLFKTIPILYLIVKALGAAYLVWLGISLFVRASRGKTNAPLQTETKPPRNAFLESVAVEALNPKTAIFFTAFLPQFIDPSLQMQMLVLGAIVNAVFSLADVTCVLLAGAVVEHVQKSTRLQAILQRIGGAILVSLGMHLFLQRS